MPFSLLLGLWALVTTIIWLVIGWRAMRAHEKIADAVQALVQHRKSQP